jgi:dTDP-4-amino-4,6-dideoxygalactose transaminase
MNLGRFVLLLTIVTTLSVSEELFDHGIYLPFDSSMSLNQIDRVTETVAAFGKQWYPT